MKALVMTIGAVAACVATAETLTPITQVTKQTVTSAGVVLTTPTEDTGIDPATLEAPAFWFDAGDTSGWTISEAGDVTRIASKVGDRALAVGGPAGWDNYSVSAPKYVAADDVTGLPAVDFGAMGSGRAMTFDDSMLTNIGTVIMVRDTAKGGGWIFTSVKERPRDWARGNNVSSSERSDPRFTLAYYSEFDTAANCAHPLVYTALMRQDGYPYIAHAIGWAGKWETFSFNPTNATLAASGLGINNLNGAINTSGGFQIAEMLVYDRLLTVSEIAGIETFLRRKWLGVFDAAKGAASRVDLLYANHTASGGLTMGIDVAAKKEFVVKDVRAGHDGAVDGKAKIVKTGAGTLKLGDFSRYTGTVELNGGTAALNYGVQPPTFPTNIAPFVTFHFDPSATNTRESVVVENGTTYILKLADVDGGPVALWGSADERSTGCGDRRVYINPAYASPTGLDMLDFGPHLSWKAEYAHLMQIYPTRPLTTVIAVVGAQRGGGWLMNAGFQRASQGPSYSTGLMCEFKPDTSGDARYLCANPKLVPTNGCAYVDGKKVANPLTTGYPDNGWHVVAYQIPGSTPDIVGAYWARVGGGLILGELIAWGSPLTEKEILAASEYLAQKWLGKSIANAADDVTPARDDGIADVQKLTVSGASTIAVDGASAKVGTLTLKAPLVKTGAGTLYVEKLDNTAGASVTIEGGDIRTIAKPDVDEDGIAKAPSFRLDMTNTNGWRFTQSDGKTVIEQAPIAGAAGVVLKVNSTSQVSPWIDDSEALKTPGQPDMPVLNFGTYGCVNADPGYKNAKCLTFDRNLESVRAVFEVWRLPYGSGAHILGSSHNGNNGDNAGIKLNAYRYDYHRGTGPGLTAPGNEGSCTNGPLLSWNNAATALLNRNTGAANIYTNGVKMSWPSSYQPTYEEWVLVEAYATAGTHASGLGCDRDVMKRGGFCLAEMILYERELSDREKVSTRNYLMKKWLGKTDEELDPVPDPDPVADLHYEQFNVTDGSPIAMAVDYTASIERLCGAGSFTKAGAGTLTVGFTTNYAGAVTVSEGALVIKNTYRGEPVMAGLDKGLRFRIAADEITADNLEANDDGTTGVKTWLNTLGDGWKAEAQERGYKIHATASLSQNIPVYESASLNGKATVRIPQKTCFQFKNPDGDYASINNIRSALWVIGSQEGGGFVLGGGDLAATDGREKDYPWHRGSATTESAGKHAEDSIICSSGSDATCAYGQWFLNNASVPGSSTSLSGGWDTLGYRNDMSKKDCVASASGLAFDGRIFFGENYSSRAGNQRLAEVLLYTNQLTRADMFSTMVYFDLKWGLNHTLASPDQAIDLWVDAGATVSLEGYTLFRSVGGSGAVTGNFGATTFVADAAETGLAVTGTVTVPKNPVIRFQNLPKTKCEIVLATATALSGAENLKAATYEGLPANWRVYNRTKNNRLAVKVGPRVGLLIYVH